ncbi:MAG: phosphate/phosphite/phosphonate ABC transporter substrate-binding protein [Chloroflexi bacterium]|nr:MAG: phosphate/phosphite/phosphonate ABC transporter substrate-binding protein [Chloroflexota bacterium]
MLVVLLLLVLLTGCAAAQAENLPYVNLEHRQPLPPIAPAEVKPLRIAVAAILSPQGTAESYSELADYISKKLDRPVELVQRRTYAEVNDLIAQNKVDIAFVCTSAYVVGHDTFGMELLAAPEVNREQVYYSVLIVPADSPATSIADLKGKVFAFTDPMSHSGRAYPTYLLRQELGVSPEQFFSRTFFTYSHDRAIQAVAERVADGAAVDSLVLDYALQRDPSLKDRVRVIHRSPPFGIPPVVAPPQASPRLKARLQQLLLDMSNDPEGRLVLQHLGFDRFTLIEDRVYASARKVIQTVGELK